MRGADFTIYDALLWEPPGGFFLLDGHVRRLERSAAHFRFPLDATALRSQLLEYSRQLPNEARKVRLELSSTGAIQFSHQPVKPNRPLVAALSDNPVDSTDPFLPHKTSHRELFEEALAAHPDAQEVLLWNERGELTETCHGNLVLEIAGRRLTPPLSSGLLPGVFRAHLLERGEIQEQVLPVGALEKASAVFMINSVRRWCELRLIRQTR